jgi:aralkylamine N-acetyltransferase
MNEPRIEIRIIDTWPEKEIVELYKAGGWWKKTYNVSSIKDLVKGSFAFAVAIDNNTKKAIGMGRLISDGISDAYIQDLIVIPAYRKKGIGKLIAQKLIDYCKNKKITWLGLISEPGQDGFYKKLGFKIMKKHKPMLYDEDI